MAADNFGDRMKAYERIETGRIFMPRLPIYARIDGRGFSKFTKGLRRPYDERMSLWMIETTRHLIKETHALIGYTQSDEISLLFYADGRDEEVFFAGKVQKMVSVLAGLATAGFTNAMYEYVHGDGPFKPDRVEVIKYLGKCPHFDARVFQLPDKIEAANAFLWREQDATKNAISMAAHHHFGHKATLGLSGKQKQEKLFQEAGVNFNDYPAFFKRGTFLRRVTTERTLTEIERARIPEGKRPPSDRVFVRTAIQEVPMPNFSKVKNRVEVIFDGADPVVEAEAIAA